MGGDRAQQHHLWDTRLSTHPPIHPSIHFIPFISPINLPPTATVARRGTPIHPPTHLSTHCFQSKTQYTLGEHLSGAGEERAGARGGLLHRLRRPRQRAAGRCCVDIYTYYLYSRCLLFCGVEFMCVCFVYDDIVGNKGTTSSPTLPSFTPSVLPSILSFMQYRLAERQAKAQQLRMWKGYTPAAISGTKEFAATVIEVGLWFRGLLLYLRIYLYIYRWIGRDQRE